MLIFALGVGLDLGWYYLNVSRLQNAADAAVVAGAQKLLGEDDFKNYHGVRLVAQYPADNPDEETDTTAGDEVAAEYAVKNLSSDAEATLNGEKSYTMTSNYSRGGDPTITMKPELYKDADDNFYYVVNLAEDIHHFFIGWLDDMEAPVVAVAMLTKTEEDPEDPDEPPGPAVPPTVIEKIETARNTNVIVGNWEVQNRYRYLTNGSNDTNISNQPPPTPIRPAKVLPPLPPPIPPRTENSRLRELFTLVSAMTFTPTPGTCSKTSTSITKTATFIAGRTSKFSTT